MSRLVDRQRQVPNGLTFWIPEVSWRPPRYASFDVIVQGALTIVTSNPALAQKYPTTYPAMADMVDNYNAAICEQMGWVNYIQGGGGAPSAPFPHPSRSLNPLDQKQLSAVAEKVKKVWKGVKSLHGWIESGEPAVAPEVANHRAGICVECPLNGKGGLEAWFTKPAAEVIRGQFAKLEGRKLTTFHDEKLGVCEPCLCPLKLKVHAPIQFIAADLTPEEKAEFLKGKNCWILSETQ